MKRLFFVRHGEAQANITGLFAGHIDSPLTENGIQQAIKTGKEIQQTLPKIELIVCSPLSRAYETAKLIATEVGYPVEKIQKNELFVERTFGVLEGMPTTPYQADGKYQEIDAVEGSETIQDLQVRAVKAFEYVNKLNADNILIVSHGAFGRALRRVTKNQPHTDEYLAYVQIPNAAIVELV